VADELMNVAGVKASFVVFLEEDHVSISARSLGEMNVQLIMELLGGGGHFTMAATQLMDTTLPMAEARLRDAIDQYLEME